MVSSTSSYTCIMCMKNHYDKEKKVCSFFTRQEKEKCTLDTSTMFPSGQQANVELILYTPSITYVRVYMFMHTHIQ